MVNVAGKGLEIGPSHSPLFPKREGFDIETLDYADADALRAKYEGHPVNIDAIEEVDYVSDGKLIHDVVGKSECYDYVFSSHAIEHVTDFVSYFQSCETLLKPGGRVVLAIPDKRFIFDALRFPSSTGDVLEAWGKNHNRHSPSRVFDFFSLFSTLGDLSTWDKNSHGSATLRHDLNLSRDWFDRACHGIEYIDVHGWTFTPASFQLIIRDLNEMGILNLKIENLIQYGVLEFYVSLTREAPSNERPRRDMILDVHREQLVSSLQLLSSTGQLGLA
ncbi:methyltransferase domain-containing protein [Novosphingobium sp.]|uniref:class I SAM-dependent methyltransferase n=1 Tax=Novosphingobium sp. TaxID=1874826 RepID=UPI0028AD4896|nr:methyltransferase domain-containing protein [Novosphingobium sp.]